MGYQWVAVIWLRNCGPGWEEKPEIWQETVDATVNFAQFCYEIQSKGGLLSSDEEGPVFFPLHRIVKIEMREYGS